MDNDASVSVDLLILAARRCRPQLCAAGRRGDDARRHGSGQRRVQAAHRYGNDLVEARVGHRFEDRKREDTPDYSDVVHYRLQTDNVK